MDTLGNGIETAGVQRMAARQPLQTHPYAPPRPMPRNRFRHVIAARRMESAGWRQQRRYAPLVKPQHQDDQPPHREITLSTSEINSACEAASAARRRFQTIRHAGSSLCNRRRTTSRSRRRARFRTTALPSAFGVVKPVRGPAAVSCPPAARRQNATKHGPGTLNPPSYTALNSAGRSSRRDFGKEPAWPDTRQQPSSARRPGCNGQPVRRSP